MARRAREAKVSSRTRVVSKCACTLSVCCRGGKEQHPLVYVERGVYKAAHDLLCISVTHHVLVLIGCSGCIHPSVVESFAWFLNISSPW